MTQEQFNQNYGRIAMPKPFAHGGLITPIADIGDSTHPVNFEDGFPSQYSAPHSQGGKYVTRGEFNAIGNLATRNDFYKACGGLNTFDANLCIKIGGYPNGAVLQILNNGALWFVESLKDNNKVDFTMKIPTPEQSAAGITMGSVDGVNWRYCYESKYVEEDSFWGHVEEEDIDVTGTSSITLASNSAQTSGLVTIRNFKYEESELFSDEVGVYQRFVSSGIILRKISREQAESLTPLNAWSVNAEPWKCARVIKTGTYGWNLSHNSEVAAAGVVSAEEYQLGTGMSLREGYAVGPGLITIEKGEILVIDVVNGYEKALFSTGGSVRDVNTYTKLNVSFDVYII